MTGEDKPTEEGPLWVPFDPNEERERVASHTAMIEEILAQNPLDLDSSGADREVVTELFFDMFIRDGDLTLGPYTYTGILVGIEHRPEGAVAVFENLRTELLGDMPDDGWEFEYEIVVSVDEKAKIPVNDINSIGGLSATPGGWEALEEYKRRKEAE